MSLLFALAEDGGGVTLPPTPTPDLDIDGIMHFTLNYDNTDAAESGTPQDWRDTVNADPGRIGDAILGLREGEGHGLPASETATTWTKPSWLTDLEPGGPASWYYNKNRKMILHQMALGLSLPAVGAAVSEACLRQLKRRVWLVEQNDAVRTIVLLLLNEGDRADGGSQGSYAKLGGNSAVPTAASDALVIANIAAMANAVTEQLTQRTPANPNVPNIPMAPSTKLIAVPTWAEPDGQTIIGKAGIYPTMQALLPATGPSKTLAGSVHHHQGMGNPESTWRYGTNGFGRPPLDTAISLYHFWRAAQLAKADHGLCLIADESNICRNEHMNYPGWGTSREATDFLRKVTNGVMFASLLEHAPSKWAGYATRTGDDKYRYEEDAAPWQMMPSWETYMAVCDHRAYDINLLEDGVIPITLKGWWDFGDPRTICAQCPTRAAPVNSYASGLAPFREWLETTFSNGLITLGAGVEKHLHRPVWLRKQKEHIVNVELRATSAGAHGRLVVMGHDKLDGTARVVSDEVTYGQGWRTVSVAVTPRQHSAFPDVRYLRATVDHDGGGDMEVRNWRIV